MYVCASKDRPGLRFLRSQVPPRRARPESHDNTPPDAGRGGTLDPRRAINTPRRRQCICRKAQVTTSTRAHVRPTSVLPARPLQLAPLVTRVSPHGVNVTHHLVLWLECLRVSRLFLPFFNSPLPPSPSRRDEISFSAPRERERVPTVSSLLSLPAMMRSTSTRPSLPVDRRLASSGHLCNTVIC